MDLRRCRQKTSRSQDYGCPICFSQFQSQLVGCLDSCNHKFCLDCILKWSKDNNDCPVDRQVFQNVSIAHKGASFAKVNIHSVKKKRTRTERYDFTTFCEICTSQDRDQLMHCSSCNLGYHMYCLKPPLNLKPQNQWNCPDCTVVLCPSSKKVQYLSKKKGLAAHAKLLGAGIVEPQLSGDSSESSDESASTKDESASTKDESASTKEESASTKEESISTKEESISTKDESISTEDESTSTEDESTSTKDEITSTKDENSSATNSDLKIEAKDNFTTVVNNNFAPSSSKHSSFSALGSVPLSELKKRLVIKSDGSLIYASI